jgi:anti-anti-sigma factor
LAFSSEVNGLVHDDPLILNTDSLRFSVAHEPGYAVVSVAGEIDAGTEQQFRDALTSVLARGTLRVVVDLAGVVFMASAGIGVLMGVHRLLADEGGMLVLASPHGKVAQVLSMTGVGTMIPMAASVPDAVAVLDS